MGHNSNDAVHLDAILTLRQQIADLQQERARDQQELSTLRAERDYFRMIADFTYDWDYWRAPDGSYRYVSPSCERITGYRPDEFQADPGLLERIVHPDDRKHVLRHLHDSEQHQQSSELEFRIITRSGEVRRIGHACQPVYGSAGAWLGQRAGNRDITAQKQAEEAYHTLVDNSLQALTIVQDGYHMFANEMAARITGYTLEELLALSPDEAAVIIHPADRAMMVQRGKDRQAGKDIPQQYTFRMIRKDGQVRWIEAFAVQTVYQGRPASQVTYMDITERKEAEEAYHTLVDNSLQALQIVQDGCIVFANGAATRLTGYSQEEILALSPDAWPVYIHPDDREALVQRSRDRLAGKPVPSQYECRFIRKDGAVRWIEVLATSIMYGGRPAIHVASIDITERKQAEEALRESRALLQGIIDYAPMTIYIKDIQGRYIQASPHAASYLGCTSEQFLGKTDDELLPDEIHDAWRTTDEQIRTTGKPLEFEVIVPLADGIHTFLAIKFPIFNEHGDILAIGGTAIDITERKQAEEMLHQYRRIVSVTPDAVSLLDRNYVYQIVNDAYLHLNVKAYEEIVGHSVANLLGREVFETVAKPNLDRCLAGETIRYQSWFTYAGAGRRYMDMTYTPYRDDHGVIAGVLVNTSDITEVKQMEEALQCQRQFLRQVIDSNPAIIFARDQCGHFTLVNQTMADLYATTVEALLGKTDADMHLDGQELEHIQQEDQQVIDTGTELVIPERCIKDVHGRNRYLSIVKRQLTMPDKTANQVLVVATDITERKQAEEALRENRTLLQGVLDHAPALIFAKDLQGRIVLANRSLERLVQVDQGELLGKTDDDFHAPEIAAHNWAVDLEVQRTRQMVEREEHRTGGDGMLHTYLSIKFPLFDDDGNLTGTCGIATDITARKRMEEALRASEARLAQAEQIAHLGSWEVDIATNTAIWSDEFFRICGFAPGAIEPTMERGLQIIHPDDRATAMEHVQQAIGQHTAYDIEKRIVHPDGSIRWVHSIGKIICDAQQQPRTLSGAFLDITERKLAEIQLQRANEQLLQGNEHLRQRNREVLLLNQMGDMLQGCIGVDAAYEVIAISAAKLFAGQAGALYMRRTATPVFDAMASWGDPPPTETMLEEQMCWALREQQVALYSQANGGLCVHLTDCAAAAVLCVPLVVRAETLGILHLHHGTTLEYDAVRRWRQLADTVARQIALALTSLTLREQLQQQAIRDALTGLYNRRYLDETLPRELHRAERDGQPVGIIMLDIDHFKRFNDTYGHDAGDTVLRAVGTFLQQHTRGADIACRYGGEELTLVLPGASPAATQQRAEELRAGIQTLAVQHNGQALAQVTVSLGVAVFPDHGVRADTIIWLADQALYQAKRNGRNRVVVVTIPHSEE
ncbi:MAG: PAS domain S-box protein [Chloroflexaceae bacterium]